MGFNSGPEDMKPGDMPGGKERKYNPNEDIDQKPNLVQYTTSGAGNAAAGSGNVLTHLSLWGQMSDKTLPVYKLIDNSSKPVQTTDLSSSILLCVSSKESKKKKKLFSPPKKKKKKKKKKS